MKTRTVLLAVLLAGCDKDDAPQPMGLEPDGGAGMVTLDAGALDAAAPDGGTPDAGALDAAAPDGGTPDAGALDAAAPDGGNPDARDAGPDPCDFDGDGQRSPAGARVAFVESFDGTALLPAWVVDAVGSAPTFTVAGGVLTITDAATAMTPSSPERSWLYDLTRDRGNQMQVPAPIGAGEFTLEVRLSFESSLPQLTLGAVALVDSEDRIQALVGAWDGAERTLGQLVWALPMGNQIAMPWLGEPVSVQPATTLRLVRRDGELTLLVDGVERARQPSSASLARLAIVTVRHHDGIRLFDYGTVRFEHLRLCY